MKTIEAISNRYSCRSYLSKKINRGTILQLLTLANQAPSAANLQNRQFIVITKKADRLWLAQMNNQIHLADAPVVILVTTKLDKQTTKEYLQTLKQWEMTVNGIIPEKVKISSEFDQEVREMKYKWMISDAALAAGNIMLAATDMGLGTCWLGIMDFDGVGQRFKLPSGIIPVCLITLGYPKTSPVHRTNRKDITELTHWDKY